MKIIDTIKEHSTKLILSAIFGVLGILIGSLSSEIIPILLPIIIQELPKPVLLKMLTAAILLFFLSIAAAFAIYLKYKPRLIPKCGVLWDKKKEAYCPACEIILSEYWEQESPPFYTFNCKKCGARIRLMHQGKSISMSDVQKIIS
jgi:hypothetical protein